MADWGYPRRARRSGDPRNPCDGCHECGMRCTAGVQMARDEFERVVAHLRACDPAEARRVLSQNKTVFWFEDITYQACLFYDVDRRGCLIYPVRPLICRLFGRVEWLPCPLGRPLPQIHEPLALLGTYARQRRATFQEWCAEEGIFDPCQLLRTSGR